MDLGKYILSTATLLSLIIELECCVSTCLVSRLEYFPCRYRTYAITAKPGINEYGDYNTRFHLFCRCDMMPQGHRVNPIPSSSTSSGSIFYIRSPNKLATPPNKNYRNRKITFYNVHCAPEEFIYIDMMEMNMDDTKCFDPNVQVAKCVDFVEVRTPSDGFYTGLYTNNCGTDKTNLDGRIIPYSSIQIIFRSDDQNRHPGFDGIVECFNPSTDQSDVIFGSLTSLTQSTVAQTCGERTHRGIEIPYGQKVFYEVTSEGSYLRYVSVLTNKTVYRDNVQISEIRFFTAFHPLQSAESEISSIRENSDDPFTVHLSTHLPTLSGPGMLYFPTQSHINYACFLDYSGYASGFQPSALEEQLIRDINSALKLVKFGEDEEVEPEEGSTTIQIRVSETERDDEELDLLVLLEADVDVIIPSVEPPPNFKTDVIAEEVILQALKAHFSNPVLKVSVNLLLEVLQRDNPERFETLKRKAARA